MKTISIVPAFLCLTLLTACGVPRGALDQARRAAGQNTLGPSRRPNTPGAPYPGPAVANLF